MARAWRGLDPQRCCHGPCERWSRCRASSWKQSNRVPAWSRHVFTPEGIGALVGLATETTAPPALGEATRAPARHTADKI